MSKPVLNKERMLEIFKETDGIMKGHFILTSGKHSDTYMQCARLFMYPKYSRLMCGELAKKVKELNIAMVASPAVGGIIMGYEMAAALNVTDVFFERVEGVMTLRRGFSIPQGARVLVVEDVVTTGGSVKEVVDKIREAGGNPVAVASIVDRSNGKVDFGVPYFSLLPVEVVAWEPENCPLCKEGSVAVKPGSRSLK